MHHYSCFQLQARLLFLGLDCSGKTTILKCLSNEDVTTVTPTQVGVAGTVWRKNASCRCVGCGGFRDSTSRPFCEKDSRLTCAPLLEIVHTHYLAYTVPLSILACRFDIGGQRVIRPYWY